MKRQILILIFLTLYISLQAQQVKPDVINSMGGSTTYSGGYLAFNVGEPIAGTQSGSSVTLSQGFLQTWQLLAKQIAIKVFLEGLYAGSGMMNQAQGFSGPQFPAGIADQVSVELHNNTIPYGIFFEQANVDLHTDGRLQINNLPSNTSGSYYITIRHRNSIETWSALPFNFSGAGPFSYDFSTAAAQAYGNNQKLIGTVYAIWGGDPTQDGMVDGSDMSVIDNGSQPPILQGYYPEDVNGDGIVDG